MDDNNNEKIISFLEKIYAEQKKQKKELKEFLYTIVSLLFLLIALSFLN